MDDTVSTLTTSESSPTQHAMLIVWGHFARSIGLLERLAQVPIGQKAVVRPPHEKLVEFQIGLVRKRVEDAEQRVKEAAS